jgi:hypothetical protein
MFGILAQRTGLAEASHIRIRGQGQLKRTYRPLLISLARARLLAHCVGFSLHSPLASRVHSQARSRRRGARFSPLRFTHSRRAHGLAAALSLDPW